MGEELSFRREEACDDQTTCPHYIEFMREQKTINRNVWHVNQIHYVIELPPALYCDANPSCKQVSDKNMSLLETTMKVDINGDTEEFLLKMIPVLKENGFDYLVDRIEKEYPSKIIDSRKIMENAK